VFAVNFKRQYQVNPKRIRNVEKTQAGLKMDIADTFTREFKVGGGGGRETDDEDVT
jgi:hypothetical protein